MKSLNKGISSEDSFFDCVDLTAVNVINRFPNCKQVDDPFDGCGICADGYDFVNDGVCCKVGEEFATIDNSSGPLENYDNED